MLRNLLKAFIESKFQTKVFVFMCALYMIALIWSTVQSFARLYYSRSDYIESPIIIQVPPQIN